MTDLSVLRMAQEFYKDEMRDHVTYLTLAGSERNAHFREVLGGIAAIELRHSNFWKSFLERRGSAPVPYRFNRLRLRLLRALHRLMSPVLLVSLLELGEAGAYKTYYDCLNRRPLSDAEKNELRAIILDELEHEVTFRKESEKLGIGNVRDYVLGMNDGLVEILGAVTGFAAVYPGKPLLVAASGLVVGIAGAMSMGIGAFISVRSQRQVNHGMRERMEILYTVAPGRATDEYRQELVRSGVPEEAADEVARRVGKNRDAISRLLLKPAPENEIRSGLYTGLAYLAGVLFPVVPFLVLPNSLAALAGAAVLAGLALSAVGTVISVLSGISLKKKVMEMVLSAFGAAVIAYGFGKLIQWVFGLEV